MLFAAQPDRSQTATCAFPCIFGVHISAIPLRDATILKCPNSLDAIQLPLRLRIGILSRLGRLYFRIVFRSDRIAQSDLLSDAMLFQIIIDS